MTIPIKSGFRFTPSAWQKLLWYLHRGDTEVGGFGILDEEDLNLIVDFQIIKQECTAATVEFDKDAMSDYVNDMFDAGIEPNRSFRVWIHFHPGESAQPSSTDWTTFEEIMEGFPWFAMLIVSKKWKTYGYIELNQATGPSIQCEMDLSIDWNAACESVDFDELEMEYQEKVSEKKYVSTTVYKSVYPHTGYNAYDSYHQDQKKSGGSVGGGGSAYSKGYTQIFGDDKRMPIREENRAWYNKFNEHFHDPELDEVRDSLDEIQEQFELDDEEMKQCIAETFSKMENDDEDYHQYLKRKSISAMSDDEFEDFSKLEEM